MTLKLISGYKMYENSDAVVAKYKGISGEKPLEWTILEGAYTTLGTCSLALSLLMMNALF